jgi:hypothetical protein
MKREPDLLRLILLFIEEHVPPPGGLNEPLAIADYDRATVMAHAELLIDDGLVDGKIMKGTGGIQELMIMRLTSAGHDAIAAIRNDTMWQKAKKAGVEKGASLTFGLLVEFLKAEGRKHLGLL